MRTTNINRIELVLIIASIELLKILYLCSVECYLIEFSRRLKIESKRNFSVARTYDSLTTLNRGRRVALSYSLSSTSLLAVLFVTFLGSKATFTIVSSCLNSLAVSLIVAVGSYVELAIFANSKDVVSATKDIAIRIANRGHIYRVQKY